MVDDSQARNIFIAPILGTDNCAWLVPRRLKQLLAFELRAGMSLAHLWRDLGRAQEALDLLAPPYGRFTEGFETAYLKIAEALIEELQ
jgi:hypothetical protein